jgi:AcrR family transcriptional regulator
MVMSVPPSKKKTPRRDAGRARGEPIEATVLARTLEELAEHGIDGASVDRIARAAELNKTSVYRRFGTREGLIAAALERVAGDVGAKLSDQGSLRKDLELIAEEVATLLRAPMGQSLARAAFSESSGKEVAALAAREMSKPRAAALAMVERARARGEWRTGVAPEVVLAALVGALLHRALLERAPLTPGFIRQVVDLVVTGVGTSSQGT